MNRIHKLLDQFKRFPKTLWVLLSGFFFVNCGANMVIPFFGIYLTEYMHLSAAEAGLAVTVTVGTPRAMALVGGSLADRFGIRHSMLAGLAILIVSAIGYANSHTIGMFALNSFISGIGYSLFTPAGKAAVAALTTEHSRVLAFSLRNMAVNAGVAIGPVVGMLITVQALGTTFVLTAFVYLIFLILVLIFLRLENAGKRYTSVLMFVRYLSQVFRDPRLMAFSVVIITYYIMLALFSLILPLYASDRFASKDDIGMLFTGNAVLMIAAQYPLLALFSRYLRSPQVAFIGLLLTVAGIGSAAFAGGFAYLMAVTLIIFTLGQILIMPSIDTVVADYAPSGLAASYQGFAGLAAAVGGIIGNTMGGTVYGWAREHGWISHVWVVYFMIGLSGCIIYVLICRSKPSNYREWAAESQKLRTTKK